MKLLKAFSIFVAILALTAVFIALSIDSKWEVQVSQPITVSKENIFPMINTLTKWPEWTVWNEKTHPNLRMTYDGAEFGKGAIQNWHDGDDKGQLKITQSISNQRIEYTLNMNEGLFLMQGQITLEESAGTTTVVWKLWGDNGANLFGRLMTLIFNPMIEKDLTTGLANLKQRLEQPQRITNSG